MPAAAAAAPAAEAPKEAAAPVVEASKPASTPSDNTSGKT